jgi:hypothetical protein
MTNIFNRFRCWWFGHSWQVDIEKRQVLPLRWGKAFLRCHRCQLIKQDGMEWRP